jgi:CBS domain-containing protein
MWCKSLTDWTKQYNSWTQVKIQIEISSVFFDYEMAFGELKLKTITEVIFKMQKVTFFFDFKQMQKPNPT